MIDSSSAQLVFTTLQRLPLVRPVAEAMYGRYFARASGRQRLFRGVFRDFETAQQSAPHTKPTHYDDSGYNYQQDHHSILASDYPVIFWLGKLLGGVRSVLDFGGNVGMAFYAYRRYLDFPPDLRWRVYDLPEIVAAGARISLREGSPKQLSFSSSLGECQGFDLLLAAGSLQYVPQTLPEILRRMNPLPTHLLLNKLPIAESEAFVTLQNTGTAFCPYRVSRRAELLESLARLGYELHDSWKNPDMTLHLPDAPAHSLAAFSGMYLRRS